MDNARLHNGSASRYFPRFPYKTARLLRVAATYNIHDVLFRHTLSITTDRHQTSTSSSSSVYLGSTSHYDTSGKCSTRNNLLTLQTFQKIRCLLYLWTRCTVHSHFHCFAMLILIQHNQTIFGSYSRLVHVHKKIKL